MNNINLEDDENKFLKEIRSKFEILNRDISMKNKKESQTFLSEIQKKKESV